MNRPKNYSEKTYVTFMDRPEVSPKLRDVCRVKYLISSHVNYKIPLDNALKTMTSIPDEDKCVVVAGSSETYTSEVGGVVYHGVTQNAYELTGLIHVAQNPHMYEGYDYVLLLHDTIECGPRTAQLVGDHPAFDFDVSFACNPPRMNIGLYRTKFLADNVGPIADWDGLSKTGAIDMEFLNHPTSLDKYTTKLTYFPNAKFTRKDFVAKYSKDKRMEAYIKSIDIKKWYKKTSITDEKSEDFRRRP